MRNVLSIAGSDSAGCAGIQADLKTMGALGVYGMTAIAAVTVQNTQGVRAFQKLPPEIVSGQINAVFDDIRVDAVKVGMVGDADVAAVVGETLNRRCAVNVVVDPVMVSKNGSRLLSDGAVMEVKRLVEAADLATPNLFEAELLADMPIHSREDMEKAARAIQEWGPDAVLIKGGRLEGDADDYLLVRGEGIWLNCPRIDTPNTNGTGCTLSSAIACGLAEGKVMEDAVRAAKRYVTQAIRDSLDIGHGNGPLGHYAALYRRCTPTAT